MSDPEPNVPPFPDSYRASGLLLHVTSLPSRWGIGDVGPNAIAWIDRLAEAGQSWWQALPLGPTGYGNSPINRCRPSRATTFSSARIGSSKTDC